MDFDFVSSEHSLKRKEPGAAPSGQRASESSAAAAPSAAAARPPAQHAAAPASAAARSVPPGGPPGAAQAVRPPVSSGNAAVINLPPKQVNPNAIVVSRRQEGNPLLRHMRNVRWQYGDIMPDYQLGATSCALFLSLRFHLLKPEYIHHRIKQLQKSYKLRVILCHVDVDDVVEALATVTRAALLNDCTLFCAFSVQECARYLETFKSFETKPADAIQGRVEEDYLSRLQAAMTTVRGVNRTDVLTLGRTFKSAAGIMQASMEELSACPGIGPTKVRRLYETFREPFRRVLQPQQNGTEAAALADGHQQAEHED